MDLERLFSSSELFLKMAKTEIFPIAKEIPITENHTLKNQNCPTKGSAIQQRNTIESEIIRDTLLPILLITPIEIMENIAMGMSLKNSRSPRL